MAETVRGILNAKGRAVWSVTPDSTVYDALTLMAEKDVGALLVMAGDDLVGIFSERDYARKVILTGRYSRDVRVEEIMTSPVLSVSPDHSVEECMKIVTANRIRHLPVLDGNMVAGVISIGDLVNAIISEQAETIQALSTYISGGYPA